MATEKLTAADSLDSEDRRLLNEYLKNRFAVSEHPKIVIQDSFADRWIPMMEFDSTASAADALVKYLIPKAFPITFR